MTNVPSQFPKDVAERLAPEQRAGAEFLIAHMPEHDLRELTADFLVENIQLAYAGWQNAPWHREVPEEIFLAYILPYAHLNERRDRWRPAFYERFRERAWQHKTATEAVNWLMTQLNDELNCRYDAEKTLKPDQSPFESMELHYATCTGLSILFGDVCRAVGIPSRIVGVPMWKDNSGNHNWAEFWDGEWQMIGDTSGDPRGLYWVKSRAPEQCDADDWSHAIYAACWRKTPLHFPLIWDENLKYVPALNVTRFYTRPEPVEIEIPGNEDGTVEVRWAGELIARKTGSGKVSFTLAGGSDYDVAIRKSDGTVQCSTIKRC